MKNSHLDQLLKTLSLKELDRITDFISSSFWEFQDSKGKHRSVSKPRILAFYRYIKDFYPYSSDSLTKREILYKKIFPKERFSEKKFRNLKYELTKIVELCISFLHLCKVPFELKKSLLLVIKQSKQDKLFSNILLTCDDLLETSFERNDEYFYNKYFLAKEKRIAAEKQIQLGRSSINFDILNSEINYNINHFLINLFSQIILEYHLKSLVNFKLKNDLIEKALEFSTFLPENQNPNKVLYILGKFVQFHKNGCTPEKLMELNNLLCEHKLLFKESDFKFLYIDLVNLCLDNYFLGNKAFEDTALKIFIRSIEMEVDVQDRYINDQNYKNLVSIALRFRNLPLAEKIINDYEKKLEPTQRSNAYSYNYAQFYYIKKDFDKALTYLSKVERKDFYYSTEIYNLELRIYYEQGNFESSKNLVDTYKHYLKRERNIPMHLKKRYRNFILFYEYLLKIRIEESKAKPGFILKKLNKTKDVEFRVWLTERFIKLEKK